MAKNIGTVVDSQIKQRNTTDKFPVLDTRDLLGGSHDYASIAEACQRFSHEKMRTPMYVIIREDRSLARPVKEYRMKQLPYSRNDGSGAPVFEIINGNETGLTRIPLSPENWNTYFELTAEGAQMAGEYQEQFAPAYNGTFYDGAIIAVNKLLAPFPYDKDTIWNDANWTAVADPAKHYQKRHRYGDGPWSRPEALYSEIEQGDYTDTRQQYRLKTADPVIPPTPPMYLTNPDGSQTANNEPEGFQDVAQLPTGADPGSYNLFEIKTLKNNFGFVKQPWVLRQVPLDGNLFRYAEHMVKDPNSLCASTESAAPATAADTRLNSAGWVMLPNKKHRYRAFRTDKGDGTYTPWLVMEIGRESGEYESTVYRLFPEKLEDQIIDNPDAIFTVAMGGDDKPFRPTGPVPTSWSDGPLKPTTGLVQMKSTCTKYRHGQIKTLWSDPYPDGTRNALVDVIEAFPGTDFKKNAAGVYDTEQITLTASLYKGERLLSEDPNETVTYQWYRIYNGGGDTTVITDPLAADTDNFGTARTITVSPDKITGKAIFECTMRWHKPDGSFDELKDEVELLDIADGMNARIFKINPTGQAFFMKGTTGTPGQIDLRVFTENVADNNATAALEFRWMRKTVAATTWETINNPDGTPFTGALLSITPDKFATGVVEYVYRAEITDSLGALLYDQVNLQKISLEAGASSFAVILSNDFANVSTQPDGTPLDTTFKNETTTWKIFEGGSEVTAGFTGVSATVGNVDTDGGTDTGVTVSVDTTAKKVQLTGWGKNVRAATLSIEFVRDAGLATEVRLNKSFILKRQKGHTDIYHLMLQASPRGRVYKPGDTETKKIIATVFRNGAPIASTDYQSGISSLDKVGIRYYDENQGFNLETSNPADFTAIAPTDTTGREILMPANKVTIKNTVFCVAEFPSGLRVIDTIDIEEIADAKEMMILHAEGETKPAAPTLSWEEYKALGAQVYHNAIWYKDPSWKATVWEARKRPEDTSWIVLRIVGEKGNIGRPADFAAEYFAVFSKDVTPLKPTNPLNTKTHTNYPLDASGNPKTSFTDNNGIIWYHYSQLSKLTYDPKTQRIWKCYGYVTHAVNISGSYEKVFMEWLPLVPWTVVDTVSSPGLDGKDGSQIYTGTLLPDPAFYKSSDIFIVKNNVIPYYRHDGTGWVHQGYLRGERGPRPGHQWSGTSLRFVQASGDWGAYTDLKGEQGDSGQGEVHTLSTDLVTTTTGGGITYVRPGTAGRADTLFSTGSTFGTKRITNSDALKDKWYRIVAQVGVATDSGNDHGTFTLMLNGIPWSTEQFVTFAPTDKPHGLLIELLVRFKPGQYIDAAMNLKIYNGGSAYRTAGTVYAYAI